MGFKLDNFGAEVANAKGTLGGVCYYRYFNENGDTLTNSGYFPANLGLEVGDRIRVIPKTNTDADEIYIVTNTANRTVVVKQVDTDGVVDSVNGKTGAVVLDASDVGALPDSTTIPEAIQYETLPTASEDELGNIYQFIGTTDATYTNGYFYKCVSDGGNPATYSWSQVSVQPAPSGLPDQTGQSGKFLTTDGTDASWGDALVNTATGTGSLTLLGTAATLQEAVNVGTGSSSGRSAVAVGNNSKTGAYGVAIGFSAEVLKTSLSYDVAIGYSAKVGGSAAYAVQIGEGTNNDSNTFKVANSNGNYEIMSADGTIPAARHASLPATDGTYVLKLVIASGVPTLSWVAE